MADAEETLVRPVCEAEPVDSLPKLRGSVRDTIAAIEAELARHEPSVPAILSDVEG